VAEALATEWAVEQIASEAGISRAAVAEAGTPLEGAPGDTAVRTIEPGAAAVRPVWGPEAVAEAAAAAEAAAVAVGGAGKRSEQRKKSQEDR
jgi:16S rRNA C1402 (ribose-2'-O) methylase RsmI